MIPGGAAVPVTNANRATFAEAYVGWLLGGSVKDQFAAFASGFHRVCGGPALSLFRCVLAFPLFLPMSRPMLIADDRPSMWI